MAASLRVQIGSFASSEHLSLMDGIALIGGPLSDEPVETRERTGCSNAGEFYGPGSTNRCAVPILREPRLHQRNVGVVPAQ